MKHHYKFKTVIHQITLSAALLPALSGTISMAQNLIRRHPANSWHFIYQQQPIVLVGSSEHYGGLVNLDFEYIPYLDEVRNRGLNLIRIFSGTYRESSGAFGIQDNTLAPSIARF